MPRTSPPRTSPPPTSPPPTSPPPTLPAQRSPPPRLAPPGSIAAWTTVTGKGWLSVNKSSGFESRPGLSGGVVLVVAHHGPQHVDPSARQCDDGLDVALAL